MHRPFTSALDPAIYVHAQIIYVSGQCVRSELFISMPARLEADENSGRVLSRSLLEDRESLQDCPAT